MASPFVQGQLRKDERLSFEVEASCACCGRNVGFRMERDLGYTLADPAAAPLFFAPLVDFTKLRAPNIIDDF